MAEKNKDLFLDMLENPFLTPDDLVSVGHSAETSRFLDKSTYQNSQRVRDKFTDSDGNFKQQEFDEWYGLAERVYKGLANKDATESLLNSTAFNESDITVAPEKRTLNTAPIVSFTPNPDRTKTSIYQIGKTSTREKSIDELAQAEKVLLNPVEAATDPSKARWGDSPNESWWGNFFGTQVLAQWDDDGEHIDPVTGEKTTHKKGDLKYNENGTYYYEALDGRDIYGRKVLNKMNTITTDGTFWNQYDFFDSDDINEKSFMGSLTKNLALVGSMFIPYVGVGVALASVGVQATGLIGTLGKMLTGSDSPTFSAMEGWAKSLDRRGAKSEYAQNNMLCWENFIDLIGDTTAQLREQRAIFRFMPAVLGKGKYGIQSTVKGWNTLALKDKEMEVLRKQVNENLSLRDLIKSVEVDDFKSAFNIANNTKEKIISQYAEKAVEDYLKSYNKLGEQLARAYMVGITVGDAYGDAKEAGASDLEAAMLTIGYAAAENKLLSSELGRWIFPELKAERATMVQVAKKALEQPGSLSVLTIESTLRSSGVNKTRAELMGKAIANMPQETIEAGKALLNLTKDGKLAWMKKWFNAGKDVFNQLKSILGGTAKAMFSNALAEGTEEVSEELLKDFSYSCFNIVKAAQGDKDTRMQGFLGTWDWNEALKRYGMSFFGGLIGGGINSAATDYSQFKDIANMGSETAMQKLVWMDRHGEMDKFWDVVSKETLADKYHTSELNEDGTYKLGDAQHNQDVEAKKALRAQIDFIHNILTANGANVSDKGLIGQIMKAMPTRDGIDILGEFRANALATSVTAGRFCKEYNNLCKAIVIESIHLKGLKDQVPDAGKPDDQLQLAINESQQALSVLQKAKDDLLQGKRSAEFYRDALFETTYGVSEKFIAPTEIQFMEHITGKDFSTISDSEKELLRERYKDWSKTERSEQVHQLAEIFHDISRRTSKALQDSYDTYQQIKEGYLERTKTLQDFSKNKLQNMLIALYNSEDSALENILSIILNVANTETGKVPSISGVTVDEEGYLTGKERSLSDLQKKLFDRNGSYTEFLNNLANDSSKSDELKNLEIELYLNNTIAQEAINIADEIIKLGYIHPEVKRNLIPTLENTVLDLNKNVGDLEYAYSDDINIQNYATGLVNPLNQKIAEIEDRIKLIDKLNYTPLIANLKSFGVSLGVNDNVLSLLEMAVDKEKNYATAIDNIIISETLAKQFEEARNLLDLYRSSVIAAQVDNADVQHIFGYNKTLNELSKNEEGYVPLAEIDEDTALLAVQEITMAIDRLNAVEGISSLNQGNKLNVLNYTAANKNFILRNKAHKMIMALKGDDKDELRNKWNKNGAFDLLEQAIENMAEHKRLGEAKTAADRTLSLGTQEKADIERESHQLEDAIYNFFNENQDKLADNDNARKDLVEFIKACNFDFYDKNEGMLTHTSDDIDDGAFIWWLASKAALKTSDFYKVYKDIISDEIAPIPTQELGIFAGVAAIANGDVFTSFGKALKQYIREDWESKSDVQFLHDGRVDESKASEKRNILRNKGLGRYLPPTNENINAVNRSDLVPSFNNILFIEGAPGTGKSTGVLRSIVAFLNAAPHKNKDFFKHIVFAHGTQENADKAAANLGVKDGTTVTTYDKEKLLKWMSPDYVNCYDPAKGYYEYYLNKEVVITDNGDLHSTWKVNELRDEDKPSVIFIDEWSKYTQPEIDLVNRFAERNGIQIIATGDLDLLSPKAYLFENQGDSIKDANGLDIARNITPRIPKLGVSMRTGNGQKSVNLNTMQWWQRNRTNDPIKLLYVENNDLYGDKVHHVSDTISDDELAKIKKDIDKMVSNLRDGEKIGYIYHDASSKLYQLLTGAEYKDKIEPQLEDAAQGNEGRYYIVENNRSINNDEDSYFKSLYTGISRAELAALVIAPKQKIGRIELENPTNQENTLIPDSFTADGIKRYSTRRRELLQNMYNTGLPDDSFEVNPRTPVTVDPLGSVTSGGSGQNGGLNGQNSGQSGNQGGNSNQNGPQSGNPLNSGQPPTPPTPPSSQPPTPPTSQPPANPQGGNTQPPLGPNNPSQGGQPSPGNQPPVPLSGGNSQLSGTSQTPTGDSETQQAPPVLPPSQSQSESEASPVNQIQPTEEVMIKFVDSLRGPLFYSNVWRIKDLEYALGVLKGALDDCINAAISLGLMKWGKVEQFTDIRLIIDEGKVYQYLEEHRSEPEENQPLAKYKFGDKFSKIDDPSRVCEIIKIDWYDKGKCYLYTIKGPGGINLYSELQLDDAVSKCNFITKEETTTPEGGAALETTQATSADQATYQKEVEERESEKSEDSEIKYNADGTDIEIDILGHTFNCNYDGIQYENGQPKVPLQGELGSKRIDNANGLIKINPNKFNSRESIQESLGSIRRAIMFEDNDTILQIIKEELDLSDDTEISIDWNFISKAKNRGITREGKPKDGGVYQRNSQDRLNFMEDGAHSEVPIKMLSLLVKDASKNAILEIPMISLTSPFTLLYKLYQAEGSPKKTSDIKNPVVKIYMENVGNPRINALQLFDMVITEIDKLPITKSQDWLTSGYKKLRDLCKLYLYTGDGIRYVPMIGEKGNKETFNLAKHAKNLGIRFVKDRITEVELRGNKNKLDRQLQWNDLTLEDARTDCFQSDIMIARSAIADNGAEIFPAGHTFILRSYSDRYLNNDSMMRLYLAQCADDTIPKCVCLIPVAPPEISVKQYLEERRKADQCMYGNEFSAYRILNAILKENPRLFENINPGDKRKEVKDLISALNSIEETTQRLNGEKYPKWKSRIYSAQKALLTANEGVKLLSDFLFRLTYDSNHNPVIDKNSNVPIIDIISDICSRINSITGKPYLTGIMLRPICKPATEVEDILNFGILVTTDPAHRYKAPDGNSYRIYSKYDSPRFNLDIIASLIGKWGENATRGITINGKRYDNLWHFNDKRKNFADEQYRGEWNAEKKDTKQEVLVNHLKLTYKRLLDKYNLYDDPAFDNIQDSRQFLEAVRDKIINTPGMVALVYGDTVLATSLPEDAGEFGDTLKTAKQLKFEPTGNGDNTFTLTVQIGTEEKTIDVTMIPNESELQFNVGTKIVPKVAQAPVANDPVNAYVEYINNRIEQIKQALGSQWQAIADPWVKLLDKINGKSLDEVRAILADPSNKRIARTLNKEVQIDDSVVTTEPEIENTICPIIITKKFI